MIKRFGSILALLLVLGAMLIIPAGAVGFAFEGTTLTVDRLVLNETTLYYLNSGTVSSVPSYSYSDTGLCHNGSSHRYTHNGDLSMYRQVSYGYTVYGALVNGGQALTPQGLSNYEKGQVKYTEYSGNQAIIRYECIRCNARDSKTVYEANTLRSFTSTARGTNFTNTKKPGTIVFKNCSSLGVYPRFSGTQSEYTTLNAPPRTLMWSGSGEVVIDGGTYSGRCTI